MWLWARRNKNMNEKQHVLFLFQFFFEHAASLKVERNGYFFVRIRELVGQTDPQGTPDRPPRDPRPTPRLSDLL